MNIRAWAVRRNRGAKEIYVKELTNLDKYY
jgi:hypothetical protein